MALSRRQFRALLVAGLIAGALLTPVFSAALAPFLSNSAPVNGPVPFNASSDGPTVTLTGSSTANLTAPFPDQHTIEFHTDQGNVTFISEDKTTVNIDASDINGTTTRATNLTLGATDLYINPGDKPAINVSGDVDRLSFAAMELDDTEADFTYAGTSGTTTLTVRGLPANRQIAAINASDDVVLETASTDANGTATLTSLPNSEHTVELQSSARPPSLSDPTPDGNISSAPSSLSVDVSDEEFPGDTVDVGIYYQGQQIASQTTTQDTTVSTTNFSAPVGGIYEWSAVATDENGNQDVVNASFGIPGDLYIRNETNASQLVTSPVNVTARFENGTVIEQRTTSSGAINMSGVGTDAFIVTIEASENYYSRTVHFESLVGNRSIYLLNRSYDAIESRFQLDDPTASYDSSTVLYIRKAINQSGTLAYRTIYGDWFGAEGVTADLEQDERYRLLLRSDDGTLQEVGPYRASVTESVTVQPGSPTIELGSYEAGWAANAELSNETLELRYSDPDNLTSELTVMIHEKNNRNNLLVPNSTYFDLGNLSTQYTLTSNESQKTWVVVFDGERDGNDITITREVSNIADLVPQLDEQWRLIIALALLFISSGVFSLLNRGVGAVVTAVTGGILYYTGWLGGATAAAGVVIAIFLAVLYNIYTSGGP